MQPIAKLEASTCTWKTLVQSGDFKIGALVNASFNFLNDISHFSVQLNSVMREYKGFAIIAYI